MEQEQKRWEGDCAYGHWTSSVIGRYGESDGGGGTPKTTGERKDLSLAALSFFKGFSDSVRTLSSKTSPSKTGEGLFAELEFLLEVW